MKLWDVIKTVGAGIVREVVPGGGLLVEAVNAFLPKDKKLEVTATGEDINKAIAGLSPEKQAALLEKEFDVDLTQIKESNATVRAMLESDAKNPQSTRPFIAKGAFFVIAGVDTVAVGAWAYGVLKENEEVVSAVMDGWPFILAVIGPLVVLLHAYFGVLKVEHKDRLSAAGGSSEPSGIVGLIASLVKRKD